jgi:hypothetical protein
MQPEQKLNSINKNQNLDKHKDDFIRKIITVAFITVGVIIDGLFLSLWLLIQWGFEKYLDSPLGEQLSRYTNGELRLYQIMLSIGTGIPIFSYVVADAVTSLAEVVNPITELVRRVIIAKDEIRQGKKDQFEE